MGFLWMSPRFMQDRCDEMTLLYNYHYGPPAFRFYSNILKHAVNVTHIHIIRSPNMEGSRLQPYVAKPHYPCRVIHEALCNYLALTIPGATIYSGGYRDSSHDFAHMLFAPVVYRSVSSMSYWAGLANTGDTYSAMPGSGNETSQFWGTRWHMIYVPILAQSNKDLPSGLHAKDVDRILTWLVNA